MNNIKKENQAKNACLRELCKEFENKSDVRSVLRSTLKNTLDANNGTNRTEAC
jgi:hypothetical protein